MKAVVAVLAVVVAGGMGRAADAPDDLAKLAGEWAAESWTRTGQQPAPAASLAKLSVKVEKDQWVQAFGTDVATYTVTLDPTKGTMTMKHNKTGTVVETTYVLKGDRLTVTRVIDPRAGDVKVQVWRRKGQAG